MKTSIPLGRMSVGDRFETACDKKKGTIVSTNVGGVMVKWDSNEINDEIGITTKQIISTFTEVNKI